MPAPEIIHQLVAQFADNREAYRSGRYNEAQLRQEFLNPFFEALGWDMFNRSNYAPQNREVIHEDSIELEGGSRAPDYCFRLGQTRKFFVEAKKPAIDIKYDIHPAYQLRRYAWNTHLPLSILTDFEAFAVYDCRSKPNPSDSAATARILFINYTDYIEKWDEIAAIFSRNAIWKGSFDKYAADTSSKKGTSEVDDAFLADIEAWRTLLARNIALRNNQVTNERQLNFAVQMTIDRLIFLRICEDRGIEPENQLLDMGKGKEIYSQMVQLFRRADIKYNSGLFHFKTEKGESNHADSFTPHLTIDDKVLKEIIKSLYFPCPYIFKEIPVEILGQVYEQFLGKVIRLTPGHQVKIEEKPEVRKAGGVYYTPSYIVDYIVANTAGKLVEGKTPDEVSQLRIVDPACGSGSFLLGAFQFLLDWHESWYLAHDPEKRSKGKQPALIASEGGGWKLTASEKKRILVNNIYGVDIDAQAVEVTKLSLLLKVLEEESGQLSLGFERVLPDLGDNIRCGNSLIGWDYFEGQLMRDEKEVERVNPFDWQKSFPQVFATEGSGGFDAVIGNPPYGQVVDEKFKEHFTGKYKSIEGRYDTFELFIEKGIYLIGHGKYLGFIVPSPLLSNLYSRKLRCFMLEKTKINEITNFGMNVFSDPTIHTCIIVLSRDDTENKENIVNIRKQILDISQLGSVFDYEIDQSLLGVNTNTTFDIFLDPNSNNLFEKLSQHSVPLGEICYIRQCIKTGNDSIYVKQSTVKLENPWKPTLRGRSMSRYSILIDNEYVKYGNWLARNWKNHTFYETPKIVIRETGKRITATLDYEYRYLLSSLYAVYPKSNDDNLSLHYLLGILNSNLSSYIAKIIALNLTEGAFTKIRTNQLARIPIYVIDFTNPKDVKQHDRIVALVERMLELHKRTPQTPQEQERLTAEISATDAAIDKLVYELYGLTEEEIRIVEG